MPGRLTLISAVEGSAHITPHLFDNVWKIFRRPGDIITSEDITVAVLETMKTEIPVKAGVANLGKTCVDSVKASAKGRACILGMV